MAFIKITDENGIDHFVNEEFIDKATGKVAVPEIDTTGRAAVFSLEQQQLFAQIQTNQSAREYLATTDWYVIRKLETGTDIPADVSQKRAEARASVT